MSDHDLGSWLLGDDQRQAALKAARKGRYLSEASLKGFEQRNGRVAAPGLVSACPEGSAAWNRSLGLVDKMGDSNGTKGASVCLPHGADHCQKPRSCTTPGQHSTSARTLPSCSSTARSRSISPAKPCSGPSSSCPNSSGIQSSSPPHWRLTRTRPPTRRWRSTPPGRARRRTSSSGEGPRPVTVIPSARTTIGGTATDHGFTSWRRRPRGIRRFGWRGERTGSPRCGTKGS